MLQATKECIVCGEQVPYDQFIHKPSINYCLDNDRCSGLINAIKTLQRMLLREGTSFEEIANKLKK